MEGQVDTPVRAGAPSSPPSVDEIIMLGAGDGLFFNQNFFPRTCRQGFAGFHRSMQDLLDDTTCRYANIIAYRESAKTSFLRMFTARRIAYNTSRTILYIGASEPHASRSVRWIKAQVERNTLFNSTFRLRKGSKWGQEEIEIWHGTDEQPIWLLGLGITSQALRGINFDDYRPDLIVLDDTITDENSASKDQRDKTNSMIHGAVKNSLAAEVDNPNAKLVMLNTPLNREDATQVAKSDPEWRSLEVPCWTPETMGLEIPNQVSAWPQRHPTHTLQQGKLAAIASNRLSIWLREKECKLINPETAAFKPEWLKFWDENNEKPPRGAVVIAVDPVPPPTDIQVAKGKPTGDFEAISVWMRAKGNYYLLDYAISRGHQPIWVAQTIIMMIVKYRPMKIVFESVAAQKALGLLLEHELKRAFINIQIHYKTDTRRKYNRIVSAFSGVGFNGRLYCSRKHSQFIADFTSYPQVENDDLLDSGAAGIDELASPTLELSEGDFWEDPYEKPMRINRRVP